MNKKLLLTIATAIGIATAATTAVAAPLPACTKLTIVKSSEVAVQAAGCPDSSCFGFYLYAGLFAWIPLGPGTDGGLIIGKGQMSGGQEINPFSSNNGEMTEAWHYGGYYGTFFTAPSDAGNVFDDQSCTGSDCGSNTTPTRTALKVWNAAWGGTTIPLGSAGGCNPAVTPACTTSQIAGIFVNSWTIDPPGTTPRKYRLWYDQVAPIVFPNYPFKLQLAGQVVSGHCIPVVTVTPANLTGVYGVPIPFTISVADNYPTTPACRVGTPPLNGAVVLNDCTSGTYTSDIGFIGTNSFSVIANDGEVDGPAFLVNVAVTAPSPTPTPQNQPPVIAVSPASLFCPNGAPMPFTITVMDPDGPAAPTCRVGSSPANGVVTLNGCISGTYTADIGFIGNDSFTLLANDGLNDSLPFSVNLSAAPCMPTNTPTLTVTPTPTSTPTNTPTPIVDGCSITYPVSQTTLTGKQGHLSITVTGNLVSVNPNGKEIKICPTTTASYNASTNTTGATVVCQVKSNTSRGKGKMKVNDHIKCTDKPVGNDKIHLKIKSGVNQKAM